MPSKGHKIATRQANLRTKKKRGAIKSQPVGESLQVQNTKVEEVPETADAVADIPAAPEPVIESKPVDEVKAAPVKKSSRKIKEATSEAKVFYPYLGMEFKQLVMILALIAAIMVTLYFVL